jgi:integrase
VAETKLPYTYLAKRRYWRFRHPATGDIALPRVKGVATRDQPKHAAFMRKYTELLARVEGTVQTATPASPNRASFRWLIQQYRGGAGQAASEEFNALSDETQKDYNRTLDLIEIELGDQPFALTTRAMIKAVRDSYASQPRKAHKIKQMVSRLYSWGEENDHVPEDFNPAAKIKKLKRKGGDKEYVVWSEQEIELFLAHAPDHIITPVLIALYTGQRANDVARMTWQQFQGEIIRVRQMKTSALLDIACHTQLRTHLEERRRKLDASKKRGLLICVGASGRPYNANSLASAIYRAVQAIDDMREHGGDRRTRLHGQNERTHHRPLAVGEISLHQGRADDIAHSHPEQRHRAEDQEEGGRVAEHPDEGAGRAQSERDDGGEWQAQAADDDRGREAGNAERDRRQHAQYRRPSRAKPDVVLDGGEKRRNGRDRMAQRKAKKHDPDEQ